MVYEDVDSKEVDLLQPNPSYVTVSSPLSSPEMSGQVQGPVYEECEMRDREVIEENPAYGAAIDVQYLYNEANFLTF